jgi:hypothetical protein
VLQADAYAGFNAVYGTGRVTDAAFMPIAWRKGRLNSPLVVKHNCTVASLYFGARPAYRWQCHANPCPYPTRSVGSQDFNAAL